jgi:hypothetical protein
MQALFVILLLIIGAVVAAFAAIFILIPLVKGVAWFVRHIFRFVAGEISDVLRLLGAIITVPFLSLFTVASVVFGRWSAASHFGRSIKDEVLTMGAAAYRVVIGHPARLLCLTALTDGLERRLPNAIAEAPGPDKPRGPKGQFEGYAIIGSLPGGGSGSKLYVAEPDDMKRAAFGRRGLEDIEQVVIKCFSLSDGSSLPQIVRESRSLDAAKDLGLVLEHNLNPDRFYYVMEYVPGESLTRVAQRWHAMSGDSGLREADLRVALGYMSDLCRTLSGYHRGGLWHKDVKPDNVIVDGDRAHLVDLGLITHMRSAMTLTTHGTEYFRDPELVRMALKGVKVNEVEGARFDVYGVGAALYSVIENSFPAHGGLSQLTRRCPEAARWIIRRAMTDYDKRYGSMEELLADVEAVRTAPDPFTLRPVDLPSMRGGGEGGRDETAAAESQGWTPPHAEAFAAAYGAANGAGAAPHAPPHGPRPPREVLASLQQAVGAAAVDISAHVRQKAEARQHGAAARATARPRVVNWWTGAFDMEAEAPAGAERRGSPLPPRRGRGLTPVQTRPSAAEQLQRARARRDEIRRRAHQRMSGRADARPGRGGRAGGPLRRERASRYDNNVNAGVAVALFLFLAVCVALAATMIVPGVRRAATRVSVAEAPALPAPPDESSEAPVFSDVSALVLRDPIAVMPGHSEAVAARLQALSAAGATLLAFGPDGDRDEHTEAAASLRKALGMAPFSSADAQQEIETWLSVHRDIDLVVWVGADDSGTKPATWIVGGADDVARRALRMMNDE